MAWVRRGGILDFWDIVSLWFYIDGLEEWGVIDIHRLLDPQVVLSENHILIPVRPSTGS